MSTPEDRLWQRLWQELDSIKTSLDTRVDYRTFAEYKKETNREIEKIREDIEELKDAAITPDQVTHMIGDGLQKSQARGLTARDRYIRYALAIVSIATFLLLVSDRI